VYHWLQSRVGARIATVLTGLWYALLLLLILLLAGTPASHFRYIDL
jgi:hypothetical protein